VVPPPRRDKVSPEQLQLPLRVEPGHWCHVGRNGINRWNPKCWETIIPRREKWSSHCFAKSTKWQKRKEKFFCCGKKPHAQD
jgi:hypothetical protein